MSRIIGPKDPVIFKTQCHSRKGHARKYFLVITLCRQLRLGFADMQDPTATGTGERPRIL